MASNPIGREAQPVTLPGTMPPVPAVARILARHDRAKLAAFVTVAIDLIDAMDDDPDAEGSTWPEDMRADVREHHTDDPDAEGSTWPEDMRADVREHHTDDCEAAGDEADVSWPEWQSRGRHKLYGGRSEAYGSIEEDSEDDDPDTGVEDDPLGIDPEEDRCAAGDDLIRSGSLNCGEVLCEDLGPGDADDAEREQILDDVPMLPVYSAEHNIFNDKRTRLGRSNLMSSFRANGGGERSADTGRLISRGMMAATASQAIRFDRHGAPLPAETDTNCCPPYPRLGTGRGPLSVEMRVRLDCVEAGSRRMIELRG